MAEPTVTLGASLDEKLKLLPERPGCYLFRDAAGDILYVGKALSLRHRARSYFQAGRGLEGKTLLLVAQVADVECIVTDSEVEALLLENNLIKQHQPRYNIRLRDDKTYPYLRLDLGEAWPRLQLVRRTREDGARYFGPYPHSTAVWETMETLRRVFPYRSCSDRRLAQPHPCLYHHIHRCAAPCISAISPEAYRQMAAEMAAFLDGRGEGVLARLQTRMEEAAETLRFEEAAELRDRLAALRSVLEKQKVQSASGVDRDALAAARAPDGAEAAVQVFFVRDGKLAGREGHILTGTEGRTDGEVLQAFVEQYYTGGARVPPEILLSDPLPDAQAALAMLRQRRDGAVRLHVPRRGPKRELVALVARNAAEHLAAEQWRRQRSRQAVDAALAGLQETLGLPAPPRRIECYDNSNLQGQHPVSAMVVFEDGAARKSEYRKFRVKTVVGADDFATMREVLRRRFARAFRERQALSAASEDGDVPGDAQGFARLPDLVIIDGGRGQLSSAREAMRELEVGDIPTFGLAKEHEWLYREDSAEPIVIPGHAPALHLLQRIRDEAHRFGLGYHRQLRGKAGIASLLEEVPGVGPRRRKALLSAFGSLQALRDAEPEAVAAAGRMPRGLAEDLIAFLQSAELSASRPKLN